MNFPILEYRERRLDSSPTRLGWLEPVPVAERQDRSALLARLEREGYLFLKAALKREASLEFRRFYFAALQASGLLEPGTDPGDGIGSSGEFDRAAAHRAIFDEVVPSAEYEAFCTSSAVKGFFAWLYDGDVHLHKRKLIRHARTVDTWVTPAHYDLVYLREGTDNLLSAWIPLGDCPATRGGLCYLERSHHHFEARDKAEGGALRAQHITYDLNALANELGTRWLVANYEAGDMVVHSPYLVHASTNNTDPKAKMRLSTDIRYQRSSDAIDPRWQNHWRDTDGL
jgi:ectoine hydroxylase-related dioxygenase (phytanoyl-CoA dioxygenase family)